MDTRNALTKVAVQYSQRLEHTIDSNGGAKERARFMDATEIKTKKISDQLFHQLLLSQNHSILLYIQLPNLPSSKELKPKLLFQKLKGVVWRVCS
jgi:hypothetical protein